MTSHPFDREVTFLNRHYSELISKHGDTPAAVQWGSRHNQELRMHILNQVGDLSTSKVLDFGCGTGHLFSYLQTQCKFTGEYVGYDLSEEMIHAAQTKFKGGRFEQRNILSEGIPEDFDYVLINGVFNNKVNDNWGLMTTLLQSLLKHTRYALAFNALSTYVDYLAPELFYVDPERVFRFCKEVLSPCVLLRHDYLIKPDVVPFEFTVYVYKSQIEPRKQLS